MPIGDGIAHRGARVNPVAGQATWRCAGGGSMGAAAKLQDRMHGAPRNTMSPANALLSNCQA